MTKLDLTALSMVSGGGRSDGGNIIINNTNTNTNTNSGSGSSSSAKKS